MTSGKNNIESGCDETACIRIVGVGNHATNIVEGVVEILRYNQQTSAGIEEAQGFLNGTRFRRC